MNEHIVLHRGKDSIYVAGTENFDKPKRTQVAQALCGIKPGQFLLMLSTSQRSGKEMMPSTINEKHGSRLRVVAPQFTLSGQHPCRTGFRLGLRPSMFAAFDYGLYEREGCQALYQHGLGGQPCLSASEPPGNRSYNFKEKINGVSA